MTSDYDDTEDWLADQEDRAIFFDEKASEFELNEIVSRFEELDAHKYDWNKNNLNISQKAWEKVVHSRLRPVEVFCHPDVITQDKHFVIYFQFLALLSGKSLSHLGFSSDYESRFDSFKREKSEATEYACRVNKIICTTIENRPDDDIDRDVLLAWRSMQAGSTAGGSWRNKKGDMEEIRLKRRVFAELQDRDLIQDGKEYESAFGYSVPISGSDYILHFASEPDIGIGKEGREEYEIVVEIKGGIDPAGVLERFGAIKKSFDNELSKNSSLTTFLTIQRASYTDEAEERIADESSIHETTVINGRKEENYEEAAKELVDQFIDELSLSGGSSFFS